MDHLADPAGPSIERRYGREAGQEWQRVRHHVAMNQGFSLIVLVVPDRDGTTLCRHALEQQLGASGHTLLDLSPADPAVLRRLAATLLDAAPAPDCGAIWVAAAVSPAAEDALAWDHAWCWGLATLNQNRNPLRERFHCPLVIVGAPSLVPLFRQTAPDLWSVRTLVAFIVPASAAADIAARGHREPHRLDRPEEGPVPDLDLALDAVGRLRDMPGRERDYASMLERAALALRGRNRPIEAEVFLRDALAWRDGFDTAAARGVTADRLGRAILDQGRAAEAETVFRQALALKDEGGDTELAAIVRGDPRNLT